MAVAFVLDFHLRNVKFTAVVNITFDFDAGADVELVTAVAFNFGTGVSFESLASDHPSRILCGGHFFSKTHHHRRQRKRTKRNSERLKQEEIFSFGFQKNRTKKKQPEGCSTQLKINGSDCRVSVRFQKRRSYPHGQCRLQP